MKLTFRCEGCGTVTADLARPFRCPAASGIGDIDHLLVPAIEPVPAGTELLLHPEERPLRDGALPLRPESSVNPFVRYAGRLSYRALGLLRGLHEDEWLELAARLDDAVFEVDGRRFAATPLVGSRALADALRFEPSGRLWVKDETGNVSGSHKARHLAGIMLYLQVAERLGLSSGRPPLAIASCGNAALAAAVVARAAAWPLDVFVPPSASPAVLARLADLGARVSICTRVPGVPGDPCYLAFRQAVEAGAVPFCCQGSDNGLTVEGGETLAWEMVDQLAGTPLDAVFVQVGGGALASAIVQGFDAARRAGAIARLPAVYAVQTTGGYPLARAYDRLVARMLAEWPASSEPPSSSPAMLAEALARLPAAVDSTLAFARSHRSQFMWPWEVEPRSVAHGILDDETYDWAAVVEGMLRSGGHPVIVGDDRLREANAVGAEALGIPADHTGTAGLAGLMAASAQEDWLRCGRVAVIFSGERR
jgi:threonine synthase